MASGPRSVGPESILDGVVFAISGLRNPERRDVREKAQEMGAEYRPEWTKDCSLLLAVFSNAPKNWAAQAAGATIVHKDWLHACYKERCLLPFGAFLMRGGLPIVRHFPKQEPDSWQTGPNPIPASAGTGGWNAHVPTSGPVSGLRACKQEAHVTTVKPEPGVFPVKPEPGVFPVKPHPYLFPVKPEPHDDVTAAKSRKGQPTPGSASGRADAAHLAPGAVKQEPGVGTVKPEPAPPDCYSMAAHGPLAGDRNTTANAAGPLAVHSAQTRGCARPEGEETTTRSRKEPVGSVVEASDHCTADLEHEPAESANRPAMPLPLPQAEWSGNERSSPGSPSHSLAHSSTVVSGTAQENQGTSSRTFEKQAHVVAQRGLQGGEQKACFSPQLLKEAPSAFLGDHCPTYQEATTHSNQLAAEALAQPQENELLSASSTAPELCSRNDSKRLKVLPSDGSAGTEFLPVPSDGTPEVLGQSKKRPKAEPLGLNRTPVCSGQQGADVVAECRKTKKNRKVKSKDC